NPPLDSYFLGIRKLRPPAGKNLDSVVLIGIVGRRNHHAGVEAPGQGHGGDSGGGDDPRQAHGAACGGGAGGNRRLQSFPRLPGGAAHENSGVLDSLVLPQGPGQGKPDSFHRRRVQGILAGEAPNSISPEQMPQRRSPCEAATRTATVFAAAFRSRSCPRETPNRLIRGTSR